MSNYQKCVIGTVLNDPAAAVEAGDLLPSDFTGVNMIAWGEILSLANRNALGLRSFVEALRSSPDFSRYSDAGTPEEYASDCLGYRGAEIKEYVRQVLDESIKRSVVRNAALIAAEAQRDRVKSSDLLDFAEKAILNLRRNRIDKGVSLGDLIAIFAPRLQSLIAGTFVPAWTPDVQAVRDIIHFAEQADFIIIAGRPGDGKSSYLRYEFRKHVARGHRAAIINLENDGIEYARNFIALETGIDSDKLKTGQGLTPDELETISTAMDLLTRIPLRIISLGAPSVAEINRISRKLITEDNIDLIGVDYLQLINNGVENRVQDVSLTSQQLRALSINMRVPVVAASQLSREIEKRGANSKPQLSDLRDSGSIEQDGTVILFPRVAWSEPTEAQMRQFPENIGPNNRLLTRLRAVPVIFHVLKNRNGGIGESDPVTWVKSTGNYRTLYRGPNGNFQSQ